MPVLRKCFEIGGKAFSGKLLANRIRALSWNTDKGLFSIVLTNQKLETYSLELERKDLANFLTYYTPNQVKNHFGGDRAKAEEWLQTSRRILNDPTNQARRGEVAKLPTLSPSKRTTLIAAQTSSRVRLNGLWLLSTLKGMIREPQGKAKKFHLRAKKAKKVVDRGLSRV